MKLFNLFKNWKLGSVIWKAIEPYLMKLIEKNVPAKITNLYENSAKHWEPLLESLFKLKAKIKITPSEIDDFCFNQGVDFIEAFANKLLNIVEELRA